MFYRRHQKNHAQEDALVCDYPDCGKTFYRLDLLHRHRERQQVPSSSSCNVSLTSRSNEPGNNSHPLFSREESREVRSPSVPEIGSSNPLPTSNVFYSPYPATSTQEQAMVPRYMTNPFLIPQIPRTPRLPLSGLIAQSPPTSRPK
jgi:hypothetical protein